MLNNCYDKLRTFIVNPLQLERIQMPTDGNRADLQTRLRSARGGLVSDSDTDGEFSMGGATFGAMAISGPGAAKILKLQTDKVSLKEELMARPAHSHPPLRSPLPSACEIEL